MSARARPSGGLVAVFVAIALVAAVLARRDLRAARGGTGAA